MKTLEQRFWGRVRKSDGCWEWINPTHEFGYGELWVNEKKRSIGAHRISWELHDGPIPSGLVVCHRCDNPRCVRPEHLFLGTPADNVRDCSKKNRIRKGENQPLHKNPRLAAHGERAGCAKLKAFQVEAIRREYKPNKYGLVKRLSERYKVSNTQIYNIVNNKQWSLGDAQ